MPVNPAELDAFLVQLLTRIGRAGLDKARPVVSQASTTLGKGLNYFILPQAYAEGPAYVRIGRLQIPHYWAKYVNFGRHAFSRKPGQSPLIWFRDPKDDPRLRDGHTPVRAADLQHLTNEDYHNGLAANANAAPGHEPMVIRRAIKKDTTAKRFFENDGGMAGFASEVQGLVTPQVQKWLTHQALQGFGKNGVLEAGVTVTCKLKARASVKT